ncbi:transposase [Sinosporangium album]|uniref:transposase n=1 Tax=Sinosporangium album TaxID=504805 RepID=UPI0023DDFBDA|nr:transposase [Sinosporangium album]
MCSAAITDEHGREIAALGVMPDHVHLLVKPHPKNPPSHTADRFKGFTSHHLRAEFPHLRSRAIGRPRAGDPCAEHSPGSIEAATDSERGSRGVPAFSIHREEGCSPRSGA